MESFGERVSGIALLDQPLRRALYDLLAADGGWVGRDAAADALGMPRSVAAFHLDKLAEAGFAEVSYERPAGRGGPGAGRPAKRYRRSAKEVAVSVPERHYDLAGALLADAVVDAEATQRPVADALRAAARAAGAALGEEVRAGLPARRSRATTRQAVTAALERLGYEPRPAGADVVLANCPFHTLARRHPALVCGMNLDLLAGLAGALDERVQARLEPEAGLCCVRLRA